MQHIRMFQAIDKGLIELVSRAEKVGSWLQHLTVSDKKKFEKNKLISTLIIQTNGVFR